MTRWNLTYGCIIGMLLLSTPSFGQGYTAAEIAIPDLIEEAGIPGLSAVYIENGELLWAKSFGVMDNSSLEPTSNETVFEAASLSKPVIAYVTLKLASRGVLDLDAPLWDDLGYSRLAQDERALDITARMVLSHTSGLPNWGGTPLLLNHDPGSAWNYSGEGFVFLAEILTRITGESLEDLARREVFEPLGMTHSSFVWQDEYNRSAAMPHDILSRVQEKWRPESPNAASSLHTTAHDYAQFMIAVMNGDGLSDELATEMLKNQAQVEGWGNSETWQYLKWGLGWGLQSGGTFPAIWHWGDNGNFRSYLVAYPHSKTGLVFFTNSNNGLSIAESLVDLVFNDTQWALKYLDYQTWDQPRRRARISLQRSFSTDGGNTSWQLLEDIANELPPNVVKNEVSRLANFLQQEGKQDLSNAVNEWSSKRF